MDPFKPQPDWYQQVPGYSAPAEPLMWRGASLLASLTALILGAWPR